jgi:plasmid stabilization system protein ParE
MRIYRLSLQAEQTLEAIIGWTIDNFGVGQAINYKNQLINRLTSLALKELPNGRSCDILLSGIRHTGDLEYYREGRHYIIYRNASDGIFVVDFVHGSRNLKAIIQGLLKTD